MVQPSSAQTHSTGLIRPDTLRVPTTTTTTTYELSHCIMKHSLSLSHSLTNPNPLSSTHYHTPLPGGIVCVRQSVKVKFLCHRFNPNLCLSFSLSLYVFMSFFLAIFMSFFLANFMSFCLCVFLSCFLCVFTHVPLCVYRPSFLPQLGLVKLCT